MGRPTKLTPGVQARIVQALEAGHYVEVAAQLAGIDKDTYYEWLKQGEKGKAPYAAFSDAVKAASAKAEEDALATAKAGATGTESNPGPHWTSAMTFLERRYPHRWGKRDPDHELKTKALKLDLKRAEAEIETLKAKLELLKQGHDPDDRVVNVIVPTIDQIEHTPEPR